MNAPHSTSSPGIDTIVAPATPRGGAVAVIRLSGPNALPIAARHYGGAHSLTNAPDRRLLLAKFHEADGRRLDQCFFVVMRAPHSFTGEDVVEIHAHGGPYVIGRLMEALQAGGARTAEPGEFSLRAFLNGKMDLEQAEGLADLIEAESERAFLAASSLLSGRLGARLKGSWDALLAQRILLEAAIDFAEEETPPYDPGRMAGALADIGASLRALAETYRQGHMARDGVRIAIVGFPNVGKSTLMNALLQRPRVLVSDRPGTTRDAIEESFRLGGWKAVLVDTAGLREKSADLIEQMGMEVSRERAAEADLLLVLIDAQRSLHPEEHRSIDRWRGENRRVLLAANKVDDWTESSPETLRIEGLDLVPLSARHGLGLDRLKRRLLREFEAIGGSSGGEAVVITRLRHREALIEATESVDRAIQGLKEGETADCIAVDLTGALDALGRITGRVRSDDLLTEIFSRFCIGK